MKNLFQRGDHQMSYENIDNVISFSKMKRSSIIFLQNIFPIINNGKIRIMTLGKFNNSSYFYESIECIKDFRYDTYFSLSLTNGNSGKREDLVSRSCLAFDFDLSDYCGIDKEILHNLSEEDPMRLKKLKDELFNYILNKSTEIGLYIHYIVDSGYGYHVYHLIDTTSDFKKVEDVQLAIAELFHYVDPKALDITRVLRLPGSYNTKGKRNLPTHIVVDNTKDSKMHRKSINSLYKRYCLHIHNNTTDTKEVNREPNSISKSDYIENILNNGVGEGVRNKWLTNLTVYFRNNNYKLNDTMVKMKEWASKINYKDNIEYRITYAYNNINSYIDLTDEEKQIIYSSSYSDFNFEEHESLVTYKLKGLYKKGNGIMLSGKEVFIYNWIAIGNGLTIKDLFNWSINRETKKSVISRQTIGEVLRKLQEKELIKEVKRGKSSLYYLNYSVDYKRIQSFKISSLVNQYVIDGKIGFEDLRFYLYLRFKQRKAVEKGICKGNELNGLIELEMAKDNNIEERKIKEKIKTLYDAGLIKKKQIPIKNDLMKYYNSYILLK